MAQKIVLPPSGMKMKGTLVIHVREAKTDRLIRTILKRNTITFDAGDIVRALLAQRATDPAPAEYALRSMRFGTSVTAPTRFDTDLLGEVPAVRQELTDPDKVNGISGEITLQATLGTADANGNTLTEAGLFTWGSGAWNLGVGGSLLMYSRQVHAPIAKTSGISLDYSWTLQFTV